MKIKKTKQKSDVLKVNGDRIERGERKRILLRSASLYDYTDLKIPVEVIRGKEDGPKLFICAAIHGDEINGVEICRRLLQSPHLSKSKAPFLSSPSLIFLALIINHATYQTEGILIDPFLEV